MITTGAASDDTYKQGLATVYQAYTPASRYLTGAIDLLATLDSDVEKVAFVYENSKFSTDVVEAAKAYREDEDAAEVMGVVAPNAKTWAYVLSAVIPGILGVLFFFKNGSIEPAPAFRLHFSIELIVMVMLGGQGTVMGPILGGLGYQSLRGFLLTSPLFKNIQLAVAGALLLVIVLFVPAGVVGWIRNRFPVTRKVLQ